MKIGQMETVLTKLQNATVTPEFFASFVTGMKFGKPISAHRHQVGQTTCIKAVEKIVLYQACMTASKRMASLNCNDGIV